MLLDTPICDFGWKAPDFTLKDANGQIFTMSEHLGEKGLLIAFICNHCPYVRSAHWPTPGRRYKVTDGRRYQCAGNYVQRL